MRTDVAIIGAGPAGLLLGHLLHQANIDFVILEQRSRDRVRSRVRAGVLEQGSVDVLAEHGLDDDLRAHGLTHHGIHLQFDGARHHLDFPELVGRTVTVYGQQQLVAHLLARHEELGTDVRFEVEGVRPVGIEGSDPAVEFDGAAGREAIHARFIVGADGFHGPSRRSIPGVAAIERDYPYAWLGILADVEPSTDDLIYAHHPDGFAMHSMRSREVSRLYLQVDRDDELADWSEDRIWDALDTRLGLDGWTLARGPITGTSITPMRSFVASTLNHGRLFLAGDAGHIVPPTGAKGLNSAIADVALLGRAFEAERRGDPGPLAGYSAHALQRQWRVQQFSEWMTELLHTSTEGSPGDRAFAQRSQLARLEQTVASRHAGAALAEQYAGLPL